MCGSEVCDYAVSKLCVYSSRRQVWVWSLWLWLSQFCVCLSSLPIPHGALCGSEVCDCDVAVLVMCLFLMAPCVVLKSVIVVVSEFCVFPSRRPVWFWSLWLWCGCLNSVYIHHGALCGSVVCDCGCVWVLCLFLMAPCVCLKSVIAVCLSSVSIPHGALCGSEFCDFAVS